jgi:hypothetical protein
VGTGKRSQDLFNEAEGLFLFLPNCEGEAPIIEVERNFISENAVEFFPEIHGHDTAEVNSIIVGNTILSR